MRIGISWECKVTCLNEMDSTDTLHWWKGKWPFPSDMVLKVNHNTDGATFGAGFLLMVGSQGWRGVEVVAGSSL